MSRNRRPAVAAADFEGARLVGRLLRRQRESLGITLAEAGRALRFSTHLIVAVEEGRFADLPPQPYARGLVGAYATLVGLDPVELLRVCGQSFGTESGGERSGLRRATAGKRFAWREWTVPFALAGAVASIGVARSALAPKPLELSAPAAELAIAQRPLQTVAAAAVSPPLVQETESPVVVPGVRVLLRCEGTTWVEAGPAGAEQRRYELGPGQSLELSARDRLTLTLGDAGVIRIRSNDRELGFIGHKGETKAGLSFSAPKSTPTGTAPTVEGD